MNGFWWRIDFISPVIFWFTSFHIVSYPIKCKIFYETIERYSVKDNLIIWQIICGCFSESTLLFTFTPAWSCSYAWERKQHFKYHFRYHVLRHFTSLASLLRLKAPISWQDLPSNIPALNRIYFSWGHSYRYLCLLAVYKHVNFFACEIFGLCA